MAVILAEAQEALLGVRILTLIARRGLTVYEVAKRSRVPLSTVQKVAAGVSKQPSAWTVWALAQVLDTSTDYLLQRTDDPRAVALLLDHIEDLRRELRLAQAPAAD